VRLFWWNAVPNLGDTLTWLLLRGYGFEVQWAPPEQADWVGIGSVLGWFDGFTGTVWGSGRGGSDLPPPDLTKAKVLALRGQETRSLVKGGEDAVLGDPALLISDFIQPERGIYTALVPHHKDQDRQRALYPDATFVDVTGPMDEALATIAGAERVISSSLHGLVLADAFGIPRKWELFEGDLGGGFFKFLDYGSVMGRRDPGQWYTPTAPLVDAVRSDLRGCLAEQVAA